MNGFPFASLWKTVCDAWIGHHTCSKRLRPATLWGAPDNTCEQVITTCNFPGMCYKEIKQETWHIRYRVVWDRVKFHYVYKGNSYTLHYSVPEMPDFLSNFLVAQFHFFCVKGPIHVSNFQLLELFVLAKYWSVSVLRVFRRTHLADHPLGYFPP